MLDPDSLARAAPLVRPASSCSPLSGATAAAAPSPSVPACALGTSAADLRGLLRAPSSPRPSATSPSARRAGPSPPACRLRLRPRARSRSTQTTQRFLENQLVSIAALTDPTVRTVVLPNHDTTYTVGRAPARGRPARARRARHRRALLRDPAARRLLEHVRLRRPPHHRHARRARYAIVPPGFKGTLPAGVKRIQSPTNLVWVLGRTLVQDAADMPAVAALMGGYRFTALDAWTAGERQSPLVLGGFPTVAPVVIPDGPRLLRRSSARSWPATRRPSATPARCGRSRARASSRARSPPDAALVAAVRGRQARSSAAAEQRANRFGAKRNNGWVLPGPYVGAYGRNYLGRAVIATAALGANTRPETVYPLAVDDVERPAAQRPPPLHDPLPARPAAAGRRVLVGDDVRQGPLPGPERDRPLRDRRPHQGAAPRARRLAHDLRAARPAERRRARPTGCPRRAAASGSRCASTSRAAAC